MKSSLLRTISNSPNRSEIKLYSEGFPKLWNAWTSRINRHHLNNNLEDLHFHKTYWINLKTTTSTLELIFSVFSSTNRPSGKIQLCVFFWFKLIQLVNWSQWKILRKVKLDFPFLLTWHWLIISSFIAILITGNCASSWTGNHCNILQVLIRSYVKEWRRTLANKIRILTRLNTKIFTYFSDISVHSPVLV